MSRERQDCTIAKPHMAYRCKARHRWVGAWYTRQMNRTSSSLVWARRAWVGPERWIEVIGPHAGVPWDELIAQVAKAWGMTPAQVRELPWEQVRDLLYPKEPS